MSRLNRVQLNPSGLSRQSSKAYKAVRQKSNADLDKTLRQLKLEHKASIAKILQEEYTLKNVQHSLKSKDLPVTEETQMSLGIRECAGSEQDVEEVKMDTVMDVDCSSADKPLFISKMKTFIPRYSSEYHKKRHSFHLPIIMEENTRCNSTQTIKDTQSKNTLPPLLCGNNNPSASRGNPHGLSGRCRSKTISIPDETRESRSNRSVMRKRSKDGRIASNTKREDQNSLEQDDDSSPQGRGQDMMIGCRYLRRSYSSPNVFDIASLNQK